MIDSERRSGSAMNQEIFFQYDNIVGEDNKLWYLASRFSTLMEIDRMTGETKMMFWAKKANKYRSFIKRENEFIFFPEGKGDVCFYDSISGESKYEKIPDDLGFEDNANWSVGVIQYNNYVFFYSRDPVITRYDINSGEWVVLRHWIEDVEEISSVAACFRNDPIVLNNKICFIIGELMKVLEIEPETGSSKIIDIKFDDKPEAIMQGITIGNGLYLQVKDKDGIKLYKCDDIEGQSTNFLCDVDTNNINNVSFIMKKIRNNIVLFPLHFDKAYRYDLTNNILDEFDVPVAPMNELKNDWLSNNNYCNPVAVDGSVVGINSILGKLVSVDCESLSINSKDLIITEKERKKVLLCNAIHNGYDILENEYGLEAYIEWVGNNL